MNAIAQSLADDLDSEFPAGKVVDFKPPNPEEEVERLAEVHRRGAAKYAQRAAETRRTIKAQVAALETDKRTERSRHEREMTILAERIAEVKEQGARNVAADERLADYNRSAVDMLTAE